MNGRKLIYVSVLSAIVMAGCFSRRPDRTAFSALEEQVVIPGLEIPECDDSEDIVTHIGYTASYNHRTLVPDWVAYELTADEVDGTWNTSYPFSRDPDVANPKASREDYSNSGWDKGHMAPRADMKWSAQALEESFYFTNVCPQNRSMNSGAWNRIEMLARNVAKRYGSVYIVCGPMFGEGEPRTIGKGRVHVPDAFFKALLVQSRTGYHAVGFVVKNQPETSRPREYAVSVDSLEVLIGRDLFPQLPDATCEHDFEWSTWN